MNQVLTKMMKYDSKTITINKYNKGNTYGNN